MKYIVTTDVWSGTQCPLSGIEKNVTIKRGTVVDFGGDVLWKNLPQEEYLKYSSFFSQPPALVLLDSPEGRLIWDDGQRLKNAEDAKRAENSRQHSKRTAEKIKIGVVVILVGAAIIAWITILAEYIPKWIH
jgi:hypothetical protein